MKLLGRAASVLFCSLSASLSTTATAQQPTLLSFEWLTGYPTQAVGFNAASINANGDFVGNYFTPRLFFGNQPTAFSYFDDSFYSLISGQSSAIATAINDTGQIAGYYNTTTETRGFRGGPTSVVSLDLGKTTRLWDINNAGTLVGAARNNLDEDFVFRNSGERFADLFTNTNLAINNHAVVAGMIQDDQSGTAISVFIDRDGSTTELGLPSADSGFVRVNAINDADTIVGMDFSNNGGYVPFVHEGASGFRGLSLLPGHGNGLATGVDNAGRIVGLSEDASFGNDQAVIWVDDEAFSLNDVVGEQAGGGSLLVANDIADNGWVVGTGAHLGFLSLPWRAQLSFGPEQSRWIDSAGGLFSDDDNWESGNAPQAADEILFDIVNGGYVVAMDSDATVASVSIPQGTISLDFANNAGSSLISEGNVTVGETASVRGGLDVIGGLVVAQSVIVGVGAGADGLVTLRDGAELDFKTLRVGGNGSTAAQFYALSGATFNVDAGDIVEVSGFGSQLGMESLSIGETGVGGGELTAQNGALVTVDGTLNIIEGNVVINGVHNDQATTLEVATQRGALFIEQGGSLIASAGGVVHIGDLIDNPFGDLVVNASSAADAASPVTVVGQGSEITAFGTVAVGVQASGRIEVGDGGRLATKQIVIGSAQTAGVDGEFVVQGAGSEVAATTLSVGESGAGRGLFKVEEGSSVSIVEQVTINNGEVLLTGLPPVSSTEEPSPSLLVGTADIGQILVGAQGRFRLFEGAQAQIGTSIFDVSADLFVNADAPSSEAAPVFVGGAGASLTAFGQVAIGDIDDGRMGVYSGGSLTAKEIILGSALFDGVFGQLEVDGVGSEVFAHEMFLGDEASGGGALHITNGGAVDLLKRLELRRSEVVVDGGSGTQDSRLFVGESSTDGGTIKIEADSRFTVSDGAKVEVGYLGSPNGEVLVDAAAASNERAPLLITGEGSSLNAFGSVAIGFFDHGVAAVENGGTLLAQQVSLGVGPQSSGDLTVSGMGSNLSARVVNVGGASGAVGTLEIEDGATATVFERLVVNPMGAVWVMGDSSIVIGPDAIDPVPGSLVIGPGGELWGTGSIFTNRANNGGVDNFGTLYPGSSPGVITIDGNYFQDEIGTLVVEIAGTEAGAQYDVLNVLGDVTIEGDVIFQFIDNFVPREGQTFDFLVADGVVDLTAASFEIGKLAPGFEFDIEYLNGRIQMKALTDGSPVPLPPGLLMLSPAAAILLRLRRRKRGARFRS